MIRTNLNKYNFNDWLKMPIETEDGFEKEETNFKKYITHEDFVNQVYGDILNILKKNNYDISNKKRYKEELGYILYRLSDNSSYGTI
jgi:hypothetical protein